MAVHFTHSELLDRYDFHPLELEDDDLDMDVNRRRDQMNEVTREEIREILKRLLELRDTVLCLGRGLEGVLWDDVDGADDYLRDGGNMLADMAGFASIGDDQGWGL